MGEVILALYVEVHSKLCRELVSDGHKLAEPDVVLQPLDVEESKDVAIASMLLALELIGMPTHHEYSLQEALHALQMSAGRMPQRMNRFIQRNASVHSLLIRDDGHHHAALRMIDTMLIKCMGMMSQYR